MQVLSFTSAKQLYCCDLEDVLRVITILKLKTVPGMPDYFKGLMDYYGTQVAVVDLIEFLDNNIKLKYTMETPLILMNHEERMLGVIVEEVLGVQTIDENELQALPSVANKPELKGSVHIDSDSALLINVECLIRLSVEGVVGEASI